MSLTNASETALLNLIFKGTTWASVADNAASAPYTSFYLSLHTSNPGEAGDQSTGETAYTGYARVAVTRNAGGWTISGNAATNTAAITFGQCTASPGNPLLYVGIGSASSGAGVLLMSAQLTPTIDMVAGLVPTFAIGGLSITCD